MTLKTMYTNVGNPWAVCVSPGPHQYLFSSNSNPDSNPAASWEITGEIYKMELDGRIIGRFGQAGKQMKEFMGTHSIDCRNENKIYTAEITNFRVQELTLHPEQMKVRPSSR